MVFYVNIWTRIASNNTISWSATNEILTYFRCKLGSASYIYVSTLRWFMSILLLKSDGATPQNIFFNVFVILKWSIHCENNIWHVKSWCFTLDVVVVFKLQRTTSGVGLFPTSLIYVNVCNVGNSGQTVPVSPRPVHDPWHGLLVSKVTCMKLSVMLVMMWNRLGYPVSPWRVCLPR